MPQDNSVRAILVTGTIGSGKTVVAADIGEIMAERDVPTAVIDLDWLGWAAPLPAGGDVTTQELILRNLRAVWPNFRSVGVRYLVLVRAIQSPDEVDALRRTLSDAQIKVVRLTASEGAIAERLERRDTGANLDEHLRQATEFANQLDEMRLEDIVVFNENRPVREVAAEVLERLDWI